MARPHVGSYPASLGAIPRSRNHLLWWSQMATLTQVSKIKSSRTKVSPLSRTPRLKKCPFGKGLVVRVYIMSPKKPNSAKRHVAKVKMYNKPRVTARIPGSGFGVSKFNRVLVRGGRANDLPGVGYSLVRGVYDFSPHFGKKKARSFYGLPRPEHTVKHIRRKIRKKLGG
jgi:small subunit ribosomal protein S12